MNIIKANIVDLWRSGNIVCITTNGFIKKSGEGVLGRGNALAMAQIIPELPSALGRHIISHGNIVGLIYDRIIAFPVKPKTGKLKDVLNNTIASRYKSTDSIPGFWCKADLELIERSMNQLNLLIEIFNLEEVYLPIPGIHNGGLKFKDVEKILEGGCNKIVFVSL